MNKNTKTYRAEELEKILKIENYTLYTWIKCAVPERLKPNKVHRKDLGRKVYQFIDKDIKVLMQVKDLKELGFTYAEIKATLEKRSPIEKKTINTGVAELKKSKPNNLEIIGLSLSTLALLFTIKTNSKLKKLSKKKRY